MAVLPFHFPSFQITYVPLLPATSALHVSSAMRTCLLGPQPVKANAVRKMMRIEDFILMIDKMLAARFKEVSAEI